MKAEPRTMLEELKRSAVLMDNAITDIVAHARDIAAEVANELEGQDYDHETLRIVLNQVDRLRGLEDELTERSL